MKTREELVANEVRAEERVAAACAWALAEGYRLVTEDFGVSWGPLGGWRPDQNKVQAKRCCAMGAVLVREQPPAGRGFSCSASVTEALGVSSGWVWGLIGAFDGKGVEEVLQDEDVAEHAIADEAATRRGHAAGVRIREQFPREDRS